MIDSSAKKTSKENKSRQRILSYASRVFLERGFRRVTVDELCVGMALSKRTFYKNFQNRDELVVAVFANIGMSVMQRIIENLHSDEPAHEIIQRHFQLLTQELFSTLSLPFISDIQTLMPDFWSQIETSRNIILQQLVKVIARGQKEGVVRREIDPAILGKVIQRIVATIADPTFLLAQGISITDVMRTMRSLVTNAILLPNAAPEQNHEE